MNKLIKFGKIALIAGVAGYFLYDITPLFILTYHVIAHGIGFSEVIYWAKTFIFTPVMLIKWGYITPSVTLVFISLQLASFTIKGNTK